MPIFVLIFYILQTRILMPYFQVKITHNPFCWLSIKSFDTEIWAYSAVLIYDDTDTSQKMTFSIKDFFSKCDQIWSFLRIWPHLLKIYLMENFIFCSVVLQFPVPNVGKICWTRPNLFVRITKDMVPLNTM